jgi:hypothetical protein
MGFGASLLSMCLSGDLSVVVWLFIAIDIAVGGRHVLFQRAWPWVFLIFGC